MKRNVVIGCVGLRGSGKSTTLREIVCCRPRLVVVDVMGEHAFGQRVADLEEALEMLDAVQERQNFALTIQPGRGDLADVVDTLCDAVFDIGNLTLACEELPHFCSANFLPEGLDALARMGRHRRVDLVYTGQRFAELPRRLTATTDFFVLFGQREPRDLEVLAERVGREVAERVERLPLHGRVIFDVLAGYCVAENGHSGVQVDQGVQIEQGLQVEQVVQVEQGSRSSGWSSLTGTRSGNCGLELFPLLSAVCCRVISASMC